MEHTWCSMRTYSQTYVHAHMHSHAYTCIHVYMHMRVCARLYRMIFTAETMKCISYP